MNAVPLPDNHALAVYGEPGVTVMLVASEATGAFAPFVTCSAFVPMPSKRSHA